jgi:hypothetical protein
MELHQMDGSAKGLKAAVLPPSAPARYVEIRQSFSLPAQWRKG